MEDPQELELLPSGRPLSFINHRSPSSRNNKIMSVDHGPSLDLQLSIRPHGEGGVEALKWQAAEQIRMAGLEKAYAERVRELTRREMELAHSEFARARHVWERARREVERAESLRERAESPIHDPVEITCHSCLQRFRP